MINSSEIKADVKRRFAEPARENGSAGKGRNRPGYIGVSE
jgi:hypothetical protein